MMCLNRSRTWPGKVTSFDHPRFSAKVDQRKEKVAKEREKVRRKVVAVVTIDTKCQVKLLSKKSDSEEHHHIDATALQQKY